MKAIVFVLGIYLLEKHFGSIAAGVSQISLIFVALLFDYNIEKKEGNQSQDNADKPLHHDPLCELSLLFRVPLKKRKQRKYVDCCG